MSVAAPGMQIRAAVEGDMEALQALYVASSMSNEGDRANMLAHPEALEFRGDGVRQGRTRVAVEHGEIVGFSTYALEAGLMDVEDLFVEPGRMRGGVGRALIKDLVEIARDTSVPSLEVTANPHALAFYEAVGFVVDGERATQFAVAPHMVLPVGPST
jgi:GNAT superfamily N-acetyltransferase